MLSPAFVHLESVFRFDNLVACYVDSKEVFMHMLTSLSLSLSLSLSAYTGSSRLSPSGGDEKSNLIMQRSSSAGTPRGGTGGGREGGRRYWGGREGVK